MKNDIDKLIKKYQKIVESKNSLYSEIVIAKSVINDLKSLKIVESEDKKLKEEK